MYLKDVFVPVGVPSTTRISRTLLERSVRSWKLNQSKHLLIFGPSKSGKTTLWKQFLDSSQVIKIPCNSKKNLIQIYQEILDELNAFFHSESQSNITNRGSINGEISGGIPLLSSKIQSGIEETKNSTQKNSRLSPPLISANQVIKFLKKEKKIVVLEDFHYSPKEVRENLAKDLKAFSDEECPWVIVGVQHKTSDLLSYNQDLQLRIAELPVDWFSTQELKEIIHKGENALNIKFDDKLNEIIIQESLESASLLQSICQRTCLILDIDESCVKQKVIKDEEIVFQACREVAQENKAYYQKVVAKVSRGGRSDGSTEKYKWILKAIKDVEIPSSGIKNTEMWKIIKDLGHDTIAQGSVTGGLNYLPRLLTNQELPSLFDYSETDKRFYLLDRYMKFVFKWIPDLIEDLFDETKSSN